MSAVYRTLYEKYEQNDVLHVGIQEVVEAEKEIDTFLKSLDCAAPFGLVVVFGAASGPAPAIEPELLNKKGCLFLTRPSVFPHNAVPEAFRENAADLFAAIDSGMVTASIGGRFPLDQIATVHQVAESRATQGATLIIP